MAKGIDTTFLVQVEILEHNSHAAAIEYVEREVLNKNDYLAIAPQVLMEFIHVVTDSKRFENCLTMKQALGKAEFWWNAKEVRRVFPNSNSMVLFTEWMNMHKLGRKRILDTMLAATYFSAGITTILSSNSRDYSIFDCFETVVI